jgi:membrane carboxypeptidase/penicillin-binding protein
VRGALAGQIEDALGKREILKLYINQVYLGDGKYGVEEAARGVLRQERRAADDGGGRAARRAGQEPGGLQPAEHPARAIQRRNVVLDVMVREGVITRRRRRRRRPSRCARAAARGRGSAPWYVAAVRRELRERSARRGRARPARVHRARPGAAARRTRRARRADPRIEAASSAAGAPGARTANRSRPRRAAARRTCRARSLCSMCATGEVRALVGGRDFTHSSYDRAFSARRQPGSAFKPIVYAAALQNGLTPAALIDTTPVELAMHAGGAWRPDDLVPDSVTSLSVRDALALSSNNAAVRIGEWVGVNRVIDMARTLGITTPLPPCRRSCSARPRSCPPSSPLRTQRSAMAACASRRR